MSNEAHAVVQIDETALDKECIRLPSDTLKYYHRAVDAKRDVEEAKRQLDVTEADLSRKVREMPGMYGLEKVTESAINAVVGQRSEYQTKLKELNGAKYESDLAQAVVSALECKKRTLTLLVELHGMGYFANPKVSPRGREAVEEMTKRATRRPVRREDGE